MAVKYRKVQRKVLNGPEKGKVKTYAVAKATRYCDIHRLCNLVSARTKMWDSEVKSVIDALIWVMDLELKDGAIVQLPDFGTFRYTLRSQGADSEKEFKTHMIQGVKLNFHPAGMLKKSYHDVGFEQDDVKVVIFGQPSPEPDEEDED